MLVASYRDGLRVPVERVAHVELQSFAVPGYALGPGDGRLSKMRSQTHSLLPTLKLVITTLMGAIVNPRAGERIHDFLSPRPERRPEADEVAP
jgi:hypothetical protein